MIYIYIYIYIYICERVCGRGVWAHVHLVWIPKRRKKVLVGQVKIRLAAILSEVATEKGWLIKGLEIAPDHVHVLVELMVLT